MNEKVEPTPGVLETSTWPPWSCDEGFDQAKAQADASLAVLVVARGVAQRVEAGEKRLEEVVLVGRIDAGALVADLDADPVREARLGAGLQPDRAAVRA